MRILKNVFFILFIGILTGSCTKEYSSEIPIPPNGNWQFTNGNLKYSGYIEYVYRTNGGNANKLLLAGKSNDGSQVFQLILYADTIAPGTYKASKFQSSFSYSTGAKPIYQAGEQIGEFIVNVNSIDSASISGTFSGISKDSTDNSVQLTDGKFVVK